MSRADYSAELSELPAEVRDQLSAVASSGFRGFLTAAEAAAWAEYLGLTIPQFMVWLLPKAQAYARTGISDFQVGAVAVGVTGNLYYGANMEFTGESLIYTVHAEQAASVNAWMNGETGIKGLAVSAAPCGYCRQFLFELVTADQLLIYVNNSAPQNIAYYLPDPFGPGDMGVTAGLMSPQDHQLVLDTPNPPPLATQALVAANRSYAPYTSEIAPNQGKAGYAGVALQTGDGQIFQGCYGENAAYNPSILPMESALVMLNLAGYDDSDIVDAVLVQGHVAGDTRPINPVCDQQAVSRDVLGSISTVTLQVCFAHQM